MMYSLGAMIPAESCTLTFRRPFAGTLKLRIPDWCRKGFAVSGRKGRKEGGYLVFAGGFAAGERLDIRMPFSVRLCAAPDHPEGLDAASILYGPIVMAALNDKKEWMTLNLTDKPEDCFAVDRSLPYPRLFYEDLEFIPLYMAHDVSYHTYFRIRYRS